MGTVMSLISHYSETKYSDNKKKYNRENIYNNNSDNIYMGNVLSKMRKTMEESLSIMKRKMNRDRRVEQIYKEIRQKDYNVDVNIDREPVNII
jgi:2-hydroxy-3-keto-5-methylthiopentenyl-1-phosphate phosphatase|tara:strand:+ start:2543 stop:2821 length:279 start_codon:yes stop_codon:yes gene_type:complete